MSTIAPSQGTHHTRHMSHLTHNSHPHTVIHQTRHTVHTLTPSQSTHQTITAHSSHSHTITKHTSNNYGTQFTLSHHHKAHIKQLRHTVHTLTPSQGPHQTIKAHSSHPHTITRPTSYSSHPHTLTPSQGTQFTAAQPVL